MSKVELVIHEPDGSEFSCLGTIKQQNHVFIITTDIDIMPAHISKPYPVEILHYVGNTCHVFQALWSHSKFSNGTVETVWKASKPSIL